MCMDYRVLNRASPKDNFPLPHIDVLVDSTVSFALFSFIVGFLGYNQIKIAPKDMEEVHSVRDELLFTREDVLCLGVGSSSFEAVYAKLHYWVDVQNGSHQVHLRKARSHFKDSSVAGSVVRIRYYLRHS